MASEVSTRRSNLESPHATQDRGDRSFGFHLPGWLFAYAALLWFACLVLLEAYWVIRVTYGPPQFLPADPDSLGWLWPWLTLALLGWGAVNLVWGLLALRAVRLSTACAHFGLMLCCGLAVIGLQALGAARTLTAQPLVLDYSQLGRSGAKAATLLPVASAAVPGDPVEGKKLFAMTCVTCHGSTGDGLNNLAPSLRASEFIRTADVPAITRVVKLGRPITDPANKSGKMMPAKGGNPFLTDVQIAHLVAFVKSLPGSSSAPPPSGATAAQPAAQRTRWVLPPAAPPAGGLIPLSPDTDLIGWAGQERVTRGRQQSHLEWLGLSALALHGLFLLGWVGVSAHLVFGWLLNIPPSGARGWLRLIAAGWLVALAAWLLVMWLFPGQ